MSWRTTWFYRRPLKRLLQRILGPLTRLEYDLVGEIYEAVIRKPVLGVASFLRRFDSFVVDSALVGLGRSTRGLSRLFRTAVTGHAQHYGLIMAAGILILLAIAMVAL